MGTKRKSSGPVRPKPLDGGTARLGPVTTFEDVADEQERYFMSKDKISLDEEPLSKRWKGLQAVDDDFLQQSDQEILEDDDGSEAGSGAGSEADSWDVAGTQRVQLGATADGLDGGAQGPNKEDDQGWWGPSRQEYYNVDKIETEADAVEEEAEAQRLQRKKLSKMSQTDFILDEDEWLLPAEEPTKGDTIVTETLRDVDGIEEADDNERRRILQMRYPELDFLMDELQELHPVLAELQKRAASRGCRSVEVVKYWTLGCYLASLASYFAILMSPARDAAGSRQLIDATELRDHDIMEALVSCRTAWAQVRDLSPTAQVYDEPTHPSAQNVPDKSLEATATTGSRHVASRGSSSRKETAAKKEKATKAKETQKSLAGLFEGLEKPRLMASLRSKHVLDLNDLPSDFGEEEAMDALTAADKGSRKKSLRFYTSRIVQTSNRRAGAGRDAGGDTDIPHKERLKDRQARLQSEAERRGQMSSKLGADLGDNTDGDDPSGSDIEAGADKEYYSMVAAASLRKRLDKAAFRESLAAADKSARRVETTEEVGQDGKRKINYAIKANKGLTPKRNKDVRNPRVRKRKKWEEKKKKIASVKAVWKGGEGKSYGGELSGIKAGVVKSIKL